MIAIRKPQLLLLLLLAAVSLRPAGADTQLDSKLGKANPGDSTLWYDIQHLGVEGKGWVDTKAPFDRLPAKAEGVVRPPVWSLSRHSAGMCVRFETDATTIRARWTLTSSNLAMPHMPATGVSGLDLYVMSPEGRWRWLATGRPTKFPTNEATLVSSIPAGKRQYSLYLPLYNGVTSVEIGIPKTSTLARLPRTAARRKPIVFWGTSITQGGCASRTGMVHTAILGRRLDRPVINLGFSGNGTNTHYLPGTDQLGNDNLGTVDGSHPTDLGFMRMAEAFQRVLEPLCGVE